MPHTATAKKRRISGFGIGFKSCFSSLVFLSVILLSGCNSGCFSRSSSISQRTVIQVNSVSMTAHQFASQLADQLKNYDALTVKEDSILVQAKQRVVRDFIVRVITETWAKEKGLLVQKEELEAEVAGIRAQYPDELSFRQKLIEQNISFDEWKTQLKLRKLQHKVVDELKKTVSVPSEDEMKTYYSARKDEFKKQKQIFLHQIVVRTEDEADRVRKELRSGKDFKSLAKQFSITPEAENGGELGWVEKGLSEIFDKAFSLPTRKLSAVLKSPYGYHVLRVSKKREAFTESFDDVKDRIYKQLIQNREQAAYSKWLEEQIRKAKVSKDEAFISSMKVQTSGDR